MPRKAAPKELLVALLPRTESLDILKREGWYHIPVAKAPSRWPPKTLAFYQGKVFGAQEAYKIRYFGKVEQIDIVPRRELFPDDENNQQKADNPYYRLRLQSIEEREQPIISLRPRRLVFIPSTWEKFSLAEQINDLFDGSPLEDRLWQALKYIQIPAERQWKVNIDGKVYFLDFAVFCNQGKLAIETDGYTTHHDSASQIDEHTWRQNEIEIDGWRILRYTSKQVQDDWMPYLAQIQTQVSRLGGPENPADFNRKVGEESGTYEVEEENAE